MAGTSVAGGRPSINETLQTMNQSTGQLLTYIQQNKQREELQRQFDAQLNETQTNRRVTKLWGIVAPTMEQLVSNAESNDPSLRYFVSESFGIDDEAEISKIVKGYANLSLLPEEIGIKALMDAGLAMKEGNYEPIKELSATLTKGFGADIPEITDNLGTFKPPEKVSGGRGQVTLDIEDPGKLNKTIQDLPTDDSTAGSAREGSLGRGLTSEEEAALRQKITQQRDEFTYYKGEGALINEEPPIGTPAWVEWKLEQRKSGEQATKEAKETTSSAEKTQEIYKQENVFRLLDQKKAEVDEIQQTLDQQINKIDFQINAIPRDNRNTPAYNQMMQKRIQLLEQKAKADNVSQSLPETPAFFQIGISMTASEREIDGKTLSFVRDREKVAAEAVESLRATGVGSKTINDFILKEAQAKLSDRKNESVLRMLGGANAGGAPTTPSQRNQDRAFLTTEVDKTVTPRVQQNILNGLKQADPSVLAAFFPKQFQQQEIVNDRNIRIAQLKINDKIANTQQYQVSMAAYRQSLQDELATGDPMAAMILEQGFKQLETITKSIDWSTGDKATKIAWDNAMAINSIAGAAHQVLVQWYQAAGIKFTVEEYRKGFLWLQSQKRVQTDVTNIVDGQGGFNSEGANNSNVPGFDPTSVYQGLGLE